MRPIGDIKAISEALRRTEQERDRERARAEKAEAALAFMGDGKGQIHECPTDVPGLTPCCARTLDELPHSDRMSADPALVNCDRVRLRARAERAEAALAAARIKVQALTAVDNAIDRDSVLAALGIKS